MMAVTCSGRAEASPALAKGNRTLLKQGSWCLLLFLLCLDIGCLLLAPFGPPFRRSSAAFMPWLLPLTFAWWGVVTPVLSHWLFQQFLSCWQSHSPSYQRAIEGQVPIVLHLSLADLEIRRRRSKNREQRRHYHILALALRGYAIEEIAAEIGVDEEYIAALILSYNTWGPQVLRARSRRCIQPTAQLLRHGAYRQRTLKASYRSGAAREVNEDSERQTAG